MPSSQTTNIAFAVLGELTALQKPNRGPPLCGEDEKERERGRKEGGLPGSALITTYVSSLTPLQV